MEDPNHLNHNEIHESLVRLYELAELRFKTKRSPAELAKLLEESAQTIHNWSRGRGVSKQGAQKCQRLYGWSAVWIREGLEPRFIEGDQWSPAVDRMADLRSRRITVLGEITSNNGRLEAHNFSNDDARRKVVAITGSVNSHGQLVNCDALQPRYRRGEILIIAEGVEAEPGSDVLVFLVDKRFLVKQLMWRRGGFISLGGLGCPNEPAQMTFRADEIDSMCPILSVCGIQTPVAPEPDSETVDAV